MSDGDDNTEEVQAAAEDFMDLDENFWGSANDCLVLDEVAVCNDKFEEFSKLAINDPLRYTVNCLRIVGV